MSAETTITVTLRIPPWPAHFLEDFAALAAARGVHVEGTGPGVPELQDRIAHWRRIVADDKPDEYALVQIMREHRGQEQEDQR